MTANNSAGAKDASSIEGYRPIDLTQQSLTEVIEDLLGEPEANLFATCKLGESNTSSPRGTEGISLCTFKPDSIDSYSALKDGIEGAAWKQGDQSGRLAIAGRLLLTKQCSEEDGEHLIFIGMNPSVACRFAEEGNGGDRTTEAILNELEEPDLSLTVRRVTIVNLAAVIRSKSGDVQGALAGYFSAVDPAGQSLDDASASLRRSNLDFLNAKIIARVVETPSLDSTLVPCWGDYKYPWQKLRAAYLFSPDKDRKWGERNTRYVSNKSKTPRHAKPQNPQDRWAFSDDDIRRDLTWREFGDHLPNFRDPVRSALRDWLDLDSLNDHS